MPNLVGGSSSSVSSGLTYYGRGNPTWPHGHFHTQSPRSMYDERSSRHYPPPPPRYHQEESYSLDPTPPPPQRNYNDSCSRGGDENRGAGGEKFHKFTLNKLRAMGVQVGPDKRVYTQTTLTQHYPPETHDGNIIPEVVVGCNTDSISCVSDSQPLQEPPSAIDILAMAGAHAAEGQMRN